MPPTSESFLARGEEWRHRPKSPSDIRLPCMNSHVHVRAVRAGVSLYKTAVLSVASRVLCRRLEGKETVRGSGCRAGTGACVQTAGYVPVQMSPCGARITVTYEDRNTYSLCAPSNFARYETFISAPQKLAPVEGKKGCICASTKGSE